MNLSIKGLKVPSKEIQVKVLDSEQKINVYPVAGFCLMKLQKLANKIQQNEQDFETQEELVRMALKYGCKADEQTIQFLLDSDLIACMKLTEQVLNFSKDYNDEKLKQINIAKKKLKK